MAVIDLTGWGISQVNDADAEFDLGADPVDNFLGVGAVTGDAKQDVFGLRAWWWR